MPERIVRQGADTFVSQVTPNMNENGKRYAYLENWSGTFSRMLIHRKPPLPVTAGTTVVSAKLVFHVKYASQATLTFAAHGLASTLRPSKVTWNNQPGVKQAGLLSVPATATSTGSMQANSGGNVWFEFDVTDHMQAVANGVTFYGWRINMTSDTSWCTLYTAEAGLEWRRPRLVIEYSEAPAAPTDLSPSGGRRISPALPVLSYTYQDFSGNRMQAGQHVQVQQGTAVGEPTPDTVWSSGELDATEPVLDLSDTDCPTVANGGIRRWRVRAKDGAGLWSGWSDWSWWERRTQGALTLNNPPAPDPVSFVQDTTPPITWTHGGDYDQVAFQVFIGQKNEDGGWENIYNSTVIDGDDEAFTIPRRVLKYANWEEGEVEPYKTEYRVTLRTWDGQNRQSVPGAPAYRQVRREFVVREGTTANITSLNVEQAGIYPWARIEFERATAPDAFIIRRGGQIIDRVTPEEIDRPNSTRYVYLDRRATLNREHTWRVVPVVDGVMGKSEGRSITREIRSDGIWLVNTNRAAAFSGVFIQGLGGHASVEMTMEDQGENFEVIGRPNPVRITNALGGAKGSVSGIVTTHPHLPGMDALAWRDRLRAFKAREGARLVLLTMDYAMPIIAYDISDAPNPIHDVIDVSFNFVQDNEPNYFGEA